MIYRIAQCNDIDNGSSAEPNSLVLTRHSCFSSYYHGAIVDLQSHTWFRLTSLAYQCCITEVIHSGLTVKEDELPKIKFDWGACLFEKLSDPWPEFLIDLRKLESLVHLEVWRFFSFWLRNIIIGLFQLFKLGVDRGECFIDGFKILLDFVNAASSARHKMIIVITWLLRSMRCWMPFLVALSAFLVFPVLFVIGTGIMDFFIAIAASFTTTSTNLMCEGGALGMCHSCNHSFAVLVQKIQSLLAVLGITIVSDGQIILQIHLEFYHDAFHSDKGRHMRRIAPRHRLSQAAVPRILGPRRLECTILEPRIPAKPCAVESPRWNTNIDLGVKSFIPLRVGQNFLLEQIKWKFLVIHSSKRLLLFSLCQYSSLDQSIQCQRIIWCAHCIPICILLHFVLEQLGTLALD
jgi:hypothetical protein